MAIKFHIMTESPKIWSYKDRLFGVARKAVSDVSKKIPIDNVDIVLYENQEGAIREIGGIGGYAPNANLVLVSLDPTNKKFSQAITDELKGTLAHELHHTLRWRNPGYGTTLLEALITEGLADHFDLELTRQSPRPWSIALSKKELQRMLRHAKLNFNKSYDHSAWFFGSKEKNIPRWTGYSLGFYLVGLYLQKHSDQRPSRLYSAKASTFIGSHDF